MGQPGGIGLAVGALTTGEAALVVVGGVAGGGGKESVEAKGHGRYGF
jgi:hypothetical protein